MGYDVFANGAFGLVLSEHASALGDVYSEFFRAAGQALAGENLKLIERAIECVMARNDGNRLAAEVEVEAMDHAGLLDAIPEDERDDYAEDEYGDNTGKRLDKVAEAFMPRFVAAFAKVGIVVPDGATILYTGDEDDRPGSGAVDADEYVIGFGLFKRPETYPKLDSSFTAVSEWHTWVTGG